MQVRSNAATIPGRTPDYKPEGYEFAIDVPATGVGTPVTVQVWDAIETGRTTGTTASGPTATGARALQRLLAGLQLQCAELPDR